MIDLASSAVGALSPHLPAIGQKAIRTGRQVAAKALYDLVGSVLRQAGEQSTWEAYLNDSTWEPTVARLLAAAMSTDPELTENIDKVVQKVTNDNSSTWSNQTNAQAGRGGHVVGRDLHQRRTNNGGLIAVVAVVVIAIVAIVAGKVVYDKVASSGLTAGSSCAEFLQAPQDEELSAIRKIGTADGVAGIGSPLALPAISYSCSGEPNAHLGDVIVKFKGQF